jgi:hypothetical protein
LFSSRAHNIDINTPLFEIERTENIERRNEVFGRAKSRRDKGTKVREKWEDFIHH